MNFPTRYQVISGAMPGGFGTAHICNDANLNRKVVIKQITDKSQLKRLVDEIIALQRVKSKYVVQIYDVIVDNSNGDIAFVEEFLPNSDLMAFHSSGFSVEQFYSALFQIACGLRDIHACNIVHRDVKPNNMKYDQDNAIKLFDFGLAKVDPLPATTLVLSGTPGFMAPELYASNFIDRPVDVYAFGATAFFLATGALPPTANTGFIAPRALVSGESIELFVSGISKSVAACIDACLSLDPSNRPDMAHICRLLKRELLFDKHRAMVSDGAKVLVLNRTNRKVKALRGSTDSIEIEYDGYDFCATSVTGTVEINNVIAAPNQVLSGSYVFVLGNSGQRKFVTFDVSHPEV